jgi:hypothetical protein
MWMANRRDAYASIAARQWRGQAGNPVNFASVSFRGQIMSRQRAAANVEPWSFGIHGGSPKGLLSAARSAVSRLSAGRAKRTAEAVALGQIGRYEDFELPLCEETATALVERLATLYRTRQLQYDRAPRPRQVANSLDEIAKTAQLLSRQLRDLNDLALHELRCLAEERTDRYRARLPSKILPPARYERRSAGAGQLVATLSALATLAHDAGKKTMLLFGEDKGGRQNILSKLSGNPREFLAREGLSLFDIFSEKKGTGYDGGPFHQFLNDIFEYATGLDPEVHGHLISAIKSAIDQRRAHDIDRRRAANIQKEIELLRLSLPERPALSTEINELQDTLYLDCDMLGRIRFIFMSD